MDNTKKIVRSCLVILILLVVNCLSLNSAKAGASAANEDNCIACHEDVWRFVESKRYIHKPVNEKDCKYCHIQVSGDVAVKRAAYLGKVTWVARSVEQSREHWLEFDGSKRAGTLLIEARSRGGFTVKEVILPAIDDLDVLSAQDLKPVLISNIRVLEVVKGILVTVTIGWDTDRQSDSQVLFGLDSLDQKSNLDARYTTTHAVTLTGVKLGKTYRYKVVSVDVVGNRSESNIQSMFTEVVQGKKDTVVGGHVSKEPEVKVKFYRKGNKCIAVVTSDEMVNISLGILPKKYDNNGSESETKVIRHLPLNTPEFMNIGVCYTCHAEYKKILTHPINVYPKRGMVIPPEYATLPDGRISCMSCHERHASDVEFRLVKADRRALCRGCHQDIS